MLDSFYTAPPVEQIRILKCRNELDPYFRPSRQKSVKIVDKPNAPTVDSEMTRARTPFGAVPISTIYGYDYPLRDYSANSSSRYETSHNTVSECADSMVRASRAMSEIRSADPYYLRSNADSLSFLPSALQEAHRMSRESSPVYYRDGSPVRASSPFRYSSIPPLLPSSAADTDYRTISYSGTSPWNSTGFAYTPRYPQSYRGTASTSVPYARRYPARRFVPSYVPIRYTRRY